MNLFAKSLGCSFFLTNLLLWNFVGAVQAEVLGSGSLKADFPTNSIELAAVKSPDLTTFVNFAYPVATHSGTFYFSNIYGLMESGECDGPDNCPFERLYIGIAEPGEIGGPSNVQRLYLSLLAFDWKFMRWLPDIKSADPSSFFMRFEIEGKHVLLKEGMIIKKGKFEVGFNIYGAYIKQIK